MNKRNNKKEKMKRNLGFPYKTGRSIPGVSTGNQGLPFKCPRCHKEIELEETKEKYFECPYCKSILWRSKI